MTTLTATPWREGNLGLILDANDQQCADVGDDDIRAHIVRCVNAYDTEGERAAKAKIADAQYCIDYAKSCIRNRDKRECTLLWLERATSRLDGNARDSEVDYGGSHERA